MNVKTTEQLGIMIRSRRKQLKVTQKELAMTCGTGLRFIVDMEKGKNTCRIGKTMQVLQSLGLVIELKRLGSDETVGEKP